MLFGRKQKESNNESYAGMYIQKNSAHFLQFKPNKINNHIENIFLHNCFLNCPRNWETRKLKINQVEYLNFFNKFDS